MHIDIDDQEGLFVLEPKLEQKIIEVIEECLKLENISNDIEISLSIVDKETIKTINRDFREIDRDTDVLSFPQFEAQSEFVDSADVVILGDIIICLDIAKEQAVAYNHSLAREICFLIAHSCFHLLGYDHMTEDDEIIMFAKQDCVLETLKITR
ncbi:rRNA maturation RNase YbeY [Candidatus Epulonipiscium viviparus]|uniref:rRNA maturation RNase YbeY n=1 Tax=Candidatus Epulonipiscium viviparus TaxID=420336 RepID=UPI0027381149|nr:rRNA maturation RNase YbeY [Candidatus Epulopiscium viviparus]